jgi:hypothetical protein
MSQEFHIGILSHSPTKSLLRLVVIIDNLSDERLFWRKARTHVNVFLATVSAFVAVGFSFDGAPTVNSQDELSVATSGSQNLSGLWRTSPSPFSTFALS